MGLMSLFREPKAEIPEEEMKSKIAKRDLSASFEEHLLDYYQLASFFPDSHLIVDDMKRSKGLSEKVAAKKLATDGPNSLPPPLEIGNWELFFRQFINMFWVLLLGAAFLCFLTFALDTSDPLNLYVGLFLVAVVILMCIVSFTEEKNGRKVVRAFSTLLPTSCTVVRDGTEQSLNPENLVIGDIVIVRSGSRVPADIRLIHTTDFRLETSSITGEAEPLEFYSTVVKPGITVFDSYNIAFNGSFCVDGEGYGIVIRTGEKTIIGQIASMTTSQENRKCLLEIEIAKFVKFITIMALIMATAFFIIGCAVTRFQNVLGIFISGFLVVIIANVPQGLPATVTTELTIIARRMASKNVFLKKLEVIESFGATTVVASDKTGTLTKNCMTVTDLWFNSQYLSARPENQGRTTRRRNPDAKDAMKWYDKPFSDILSVICICNKARIDSTIKHTIKGMPKRGGDAEKGSRHEPVSSTTELQITGSPSEVALLRYACSLLPVQEMRTACHVVFEIPFNSVRKWHLVITRKPLSRVDTQLSLATSEASRATGISDPKEDMYEYTVMIKGAPEVLVAKCNEIADDQGVNPLDAERMIEFQEAYENFGNEGCRVIGFAMKKFRAPANIVFSAKSENFPMSDWTFLGMAAIMDPPRDDTAAAITACRDAGIKVFMVTGDHQSTAAAIARQIGLIGRTEVTNHNSEGFQVTLTEADQQDWAVVNGSELADLTRRQWDELLKNRAIVFARTTPEQKLLIVEECQSRGEVVAVTGDGVNDAPALKRADVGVAMGKTGSDVAKQAADIVLLDDRFASIVHGIEEGRLLFDNLRKTIAYTLVHLWPELVPIMLNFFVGFPMGLTPVQILSIDLITDIPPAVSLAYESAEKDIMKQPPRKKHNRLVSKGLLIYSYLIMSIFVSVGSVLAYLFVYWHHGVSPSELVFTSEHYFKHGALNFTSVNTGRIYFEPEQVDIAAQAAAAFHLTVVVSQACHLWMCMTRRVSIFVHGIANIVAIFAVIIDLLFICLFVYTPGVNYIFGARPPPYQVWFFPLGVGVCMWIYNEGRKWLIRNRPKSPIVRLIKW